MSSIYYASSASNPLASTATTYMERYQSAVNQSVERISSGKKFNSASDNPSGTAYVSRLQAAIMSYKKLNDNLQDSISMLQTADSAVTGTSGITSILSSIREKSIEAQGSTLTSQDKADLQQEIEDLIDELDEIATTTEFNTKKLLNGELGAKVSSSDSALDGYATDIISSGSYLFTDVEGATQHVFDADNATAASASLTASDVNYTASIGTSGSITLSGTATADGDYEVIFTSSSEFYVYNNDTGVLTASGSVDSEFTVNGLDITIASDGDFAEDYKINFSTTNGTTAITTDEGNRGESASITLGGETWGSDTMMNSAFYIKFQYDSGELKYAAFDSDDTRMGSWVASGEEFEAYDSSKLDGSTFTFTSADAGIGDIWRVEFGSYGSLSSAGGTVSISNATASFTFSYTGDDRLSDVVDAINENGGDIATAYLDTDNGSSILNIQAVEYGEEYRLSMYDTEGNMVSTLGLTEEADTGTDATLTYSGQVYESSSGYFYDIEDNLVFEVAHGADVASGYVNVSDKSIIQYTNANGGTDGVSIFIRDVTASGLGLTRADGEYAIDVTTSTGAEDAVSLVDDALDTVSGVAAGVGSLVNILSGHENFVTDMYTEFEGSLSNHEDTDYAEETANYYAAVAGRDAAAAMVAQANLMPSRVLSLLGITS